MLQIITERKDLEEILKVVLREVLPDALSNLGTRISGKKFISINEAAQSSGLSERQIRTLVDNRKVEYHQPGKKISLHADSFYRYLETIRVKQKGKMV